MRRCIDDGSMAFFSTWGPHGTTLETLVAVEGRRWSIEDGFETAKNELGTNHNETRYWHGWHRHVSLVVLTSPCSPRSAITPMPRLLRRQKDRQHPQQILIRWSKQEIRRIAVRPAQRRIEPAHVVSWCLWRRAHQAMTRKAHHILKMQL